MANQPARRRTRRRARPRRAVAARTPPLANVLRRVCAELTAAGARYALVGGLAVSARAEPRLTRDVDLAIAAASDDAAEAIVRALASRGYQVATVLEHTGTGRLATVRLRAPDDRILVDLLFASCGIESEIVAAAELLEILPALRVPVARTGPALRRPHGSHRARLRRSWPVDRRPAAADRSPARGGRHRRGLAARHLLADGGSSCRAGAGAVDPHEIVSAPAEGGIRAGAPPAVIPVSGLHVPKPHL
jgi:hypothetical protein